MKGIEPTHDGGRVSVPPSLLDGRGSHADHYVLRVVGDAMTDEGILDGDFLIVLRRQTFEPGEMVVATVGDDATVKRAYPEADGMVRLEALGRGMKPVRVPAGELKVQGIAVGLMRKIPRGGPRT